MSLDQQNRNHAQLAARKIKDKKSSSQSVFGTIWGWINGTAQGIAHAIFGPIGNAIKVIRFGFDEWTHLLGEYYKALWRGLTWLDRTEIHWLEGFIKRLSERNRAKEQSDFRYLIRLIYVTTAQVLALAFAAVRRERTARQHAVGAAEARARREARAVLQTVQREAASGYRTGYSGRVTLIQHLLDLAVTRDPVLRDLVNTAIRGLLDFASVDDPVARWALQFALRDIIDRLGIDRGIGDLTAALLAPIIGEPKPRDLHDVIMDISLRLGAVEQQWARFFDDGGAQVEQAGSSWRDMTSLAADAGVLAFVAQGVLDPHAWASEISGTLGALGNDTVTGIADLIRRA